MIKYSNIQVKNLKTGSQSLVIDAQAQKVAPAAHVSWARSFNSHPRSPKTCFESPKTYPQSPKTHTQSPKTHTQSPKTHTQSPKTHTQSPKTHTQSPKTHAQSPKTHAQSPKTCCCAQKKQTAYLDTMSLSFTIINRIRVLTY
jgi:hypothetical protein